MVFAGRVLRYLFGPKGEVTGNCRKLYVEELVSLQSSPDIIKVI